ncbi:toll/interleukin-1 receptor domain-containing protein [Thiomicrorhabdus sp. 6S3-12]|uniref:toll/interleukin-1 receptor domain-containing protein n=1 Tax=Thiomicrorhabdus sp. 6S3-12 TaxID=2819681 RepID=UPI001AAE05E2|nr:toll/interleukin-1 receptor domain-containing protein [Thiomicrorhabdus sp. 6S3-12]MBO1924584.1 toll/interleukin-1 receptor domain-containing protein [Thiomicrorhabdus sp. 6S3-12]
MAFNVFISYSTKDLDTVNHIKGMLENPHIETFFAENSVEPGESLTGKIYPAIKSADLFLLMWSSNSQDSKWVAQEIELAKSENKTIVPIKLDSESKMPIALGDIKYIPFHESPEKVLSWIQTTVFSTAKSKSWEPIVWLVLGAALIWLLSQKKA